MKTIRNIFDIVFGCICVSLFAAGMPSEVSAESPGKVRLFILSGQSNMARFDPSVTFQPALKKAYPDDEVIVVKSAQGGQPIRRWYKQWKSSPEVAPTSPARKRKRDAFDVAPPGDLYEVLMKEVRSAVGSKKVDTVAFFWMQGERDAKEGLSAVYAESLRGVICQLRDDLKQPDMRVVIGRLSDCQNGEKHWDAVRAAQQQVAESDPLAGWVDTDDLNGATNQLHYNVAGYAEFGRRLAAKALELAGKKSKR